MGGRDRDRDRGGKLGFSCPPSSETLAELIPEGLGFLMASFAPAYDQDCRDGEERPPSSGGKLGFGPPSSSETLAELIPNGLGFLAKESFCGVEAEAEEAALELEQVIMHPSILLAITHYE